MAKVIAYDALNNLTVSESFDVVIELVTVKVGTVRSIQPSQIEAHMSMFDADMKKADKEKARLIIDARKPSVELEQKLKAVND